MVLHLAVQDLRQLVTIGVPLLKLLAILLLQIQSCLVLAFDGIEYSFLLCHLNVDLDYVPSQSLGDFRVLRYRDVHLPGLGMPPFKLDLHLVGLLGKFPAVALEVLILSLIRFHLSQDRHLRRIALVYPLFPSLAYLILLVKFNA